MPKSVLHTLARTIFSCLYGYMKPSQEIIPLTRLIKDLGQRRIAIEGRDMLMYSVEQKAVTGCHSPSRFLLHQGNPAPNTRRIGAVRTAAVGFQLHGKGVPREGKVFLILLHPAFIGFPEVSRSAPGVGM